ncbi:hypothetical protein V1511DRAFT_488114 [Dipodascopsis uninucleata]
MPPKLKGPVLSLTVDNLTKLDPSDAENLFSIWTLFSKCAENVENGRRLENLSWRLWNREASMTQNDEPIAKECPELSSSVDSVTSQKSTKSHLRKSSTVEKFQKVIESFNTASEDHWKTLYSQKQKQQKSPELIADEDNRNKTSKSKQVRLQNQETPYSQSFSQLSGADSKPGIEDSYDNGSQRDVSPKSEEMSDEESSNLTRAAPSTTSIVRGFSPSAISVHSVRSELFMNASKPSHQQSEHSNISGQNLTTGVAVRSDSSRPSNNNGGKKMFFIESSPSESDGFGESVSPAGNPVGSHTHKSSFLSKKSNSVLGNSSNVRKQTSFRNEVVTIPSPDEVIDEDMDDIIEDDVSESAIDDADSDWDSVDESGPPSFDESSFFVREEAPMIRSRPSLLSTLLHTQPDRSALSNVASRSTPALSNTLTPQTGLRSHQHQIGTNTQSLLQQEIARQAGSKSTQTKIATSPHTTMEPVQVPSLTSSTAATSNQQPALSPRSTRRNMLATELSESLRRNLLWERQQRNVTSSAVLKRRHTAHDVSNLTSYPEPVRSGAHSSFDNRTNEFDHTEFGYHSRGW